MFKNIVFVIIFVVVYAFIGIYFTTNPNNDSSDFSNGGSVTNSVYTNTKYGFSIDLSEDWIYYTPETVNSARIAEYGINMDELENATLLFGFAKPHKSVVCYVMNQVFTARDLNLDSLRELAYYTSVYTEETGGNVYDYGAGLIGTGDEVYYYYVDCSFKGEDASLMYILFNTNKDSSILICASYPIGEKDSFIEFFEKNLKIDKGADTKPGTAM